MIRSGGEIIHSWEQALTLNSDLPHGDIIKINSCGPFHELRDEGNLINLDVGKSFKRFFEFVLRQQVIRREFGRIPDGWIEYCAHKDKNTALFGPRWTLPFCYFSKFYSDCFASTLGLDIGCNTPPHQINNILDVSIRNQVDVPHYDDEVEPNIPHYRYYQRLGCHMLGIDLQPYFTSSWDIIAGDIRMLAVDDELIDFFTMAMIFGPGNPAKTFLDVALCLAELRRTSAPNSLIYIADFIIMPSFVVASIEAGFKVFANNSYENGVPIGIFLTKKDTKFHESKFSPIFSYLSNNELNILDTKRPQQIIGRNLLSSNDLHPRVIYASLT